MPCKILSPVTGVERVDRCRGFIARQRFQTFGIAESHSRDPETISSRETTVYLRAMRLRQPDNALAVFRVSLVGDHEAGDPD